MADRIEVPGVFVFENKTVTFIATDAGRELDVTALLADPVSGKYIKAILGVGFQRLESALVGGDVSQSGQELGSEINKAMQAMEAEAAKAVEFQRQAKERLEAVQARFRNDENESGAGPATGGPGENGTADPVPK